MHLCKGYRLGGGIRADAPMVFSLKTDKSACVCTDNQEGSIRTESRWMMQGKAAAVELMDTAEFAEQRGVAQYTSYLRTTGRLKKF